jgi:RecA/RadA recombinase
VKLGIDTSNLLIAQPDNEKASEIADQLIRD